MPDEPARIAREKRTLRAMVDLYCRAHHATAGEPCSQCSDLLNYALCRLDRCPFGADKTTCVNCPVHCYKPAMREQAKTVMRYAGPRMIWKHPILALMHVVDGRRDPKST